MYTQENLESGLTLVEIDLPTGYIVTNETLKNSALFEQSINLKSAEFTNNAMVMLFDKVSISIYLHSHCSRLR